MNNFGFPVNFNKQELQNAVFQRLATAPASPVAGQYYVNTTDGLLYKRNEGNTAWETIGGSGWSQDSYTGFETGSDSKVIVNNNASSVFLLLEDDAVFNGTVSLALTFSITKNTRVFVYVKGNSLATYNLNWLGGGIVLGMTANQWAELQYIPVSTSLYVLATSTNPNPLDRANHTGTQPSSTISDFNSAVDARVAAGTVGLFDDRGNYDASVGTFPTTGGSGSAGAVMKGDLWRVSVAGTLGGVAYQVGGSFRALVDSPGQTGSNWATLTQDDNTGGVTYATGTEAKAKTENAKAVTPAALADFVYANNAVNFGNGSATQFDFTHAFSVVSNTKIIKNSTKETWGFLVTELNATTVRVNTGLVPTTDEFSIVISGK